MVVPRAGQSIDLPALVASLVSHKVVRQYLPERRIASDALPATPAGKIQKFKLREMLRDAPGARA